MAKSQQPAADLLPQLKQYLETLKIISGKPYVPLWKLASEMGLKQVPLYAFIQANPDYFKASEHKEKKVKRFRNDSLTENLTGNKYSEEEIEKEAGFCIFEVYESPEQNPETQAWLDARILQYAKYIHVKRISAKTYVIQVDDRDEEMRTHLWRNTPDKVISLVKRFDLNEIEDGVFGVTAQLLSKLYAAGWKTNNVSIND